MPAIQRGPQPTRKQRVEEYDGPEMPHRLPDHGRLRGLVQKAFGPRIVDVLRPRIELAACMGIQSYERAGEIATLYVEQGYSTLKTKAGEGLNLRNLGQIRGPGAGDRSSNRVFRARLDRGGQS